MGPQLLQKTSFYRSGASTDLGTLANFPRAHSLSHSKRRAPGGPRLHCISLGAPLGPRIFVSVQAREWGKKKKTGIKKACVLSRAPDHRNPNKRLGASLYGGDWVFHRIPRLENGGYPGPGANGGRGGARNAPLLGRSENGKRDRRPPPLAGGLSTFPCFFTAFILHPAGGRLKLSPLYFRGKQGRKGLWRVFFRVGGFLVRFAALGPWAFALKRASS